MYNKVTGKNEYFHIFSIKRQFRVLQLFYKKKIHKNYSNFAWEATYKVNCWSFVVFDTIALVH